MKLTSVLPAVAGFLILTGCEMPSPSLLSLDPVATENDSTADAALVGTWEGAGDHGSLCVIRPGEHGAYEIAFLGGDSHLGFEAQLIRIGDVELLDLVPTNDDDFRVPGHAVARIWTSGTTLRWAFLDSDWLKQQAAQLAARQSDGKLLLLSPSSVVRAFLAAHASDDQAYGKVVTWQKLM